jgi:hypothetical protein
MNHGMCLTGSHTGIVLAYCGLCLRDRVPRLCSGIPIKQTASTVPVPHIIQARHTCVIGATVIFLQEPCDVCLQQTAG